MSHVMTMLQDVKHDIERVIAKGDLENEEEIMHDMLSRVSEISMTPELIMKSGLGEMIATVREKFNFSTKVPELARAILLSWRTIMKISKSKAAPVKDTKPTNDASKKVVPVAASPSVPIASPPPKPAEPSVGRKISLPSERRPIYTVFYNIYKSSVSNQQAEQLALDIEEALHSQNQGNLKQYSAKAKTIAFNLNKNKVL
ncbi:hypothetical protein EON65_52585 [archaeon]|nr:MAG: hypothetical protein EON65_52585 [archaeon]